jgi:predicted porin
MKKSLIALAALAAVGAVSAQSSVTMYGRIDMGWGAATTKAANGAQDKTTGLVDGVQTSNAIGFRGTEDLGGGLTAGFNLEQGISPTQAGGWNQRLGSSAHQVAGGGAITANTMRADFGHHPVERWLHGCQPLGFLR